MRWGYRVLILAVAVALVATGCSNDDDGGSGSAASSKAAVTTSSTTSSTSSSTSTTAAPVTQASTATTAAKAAAPGTTRPKTTVATQPPTTTTTRPTCIATVSSSAPSFGTDDPEDVRSVTVNLGNQSGVPVTVVIRGTSYPLSAGAAQQITLEPTHSGEVITAAPASKPGDRFSYSVHLFPGYGYTFNVKSMDIGTCNASGVRQAVYLRQDGLQSRSG